MIRGPKPGTSRRRAAPLLALALLAATAFGPGPAGLRVREAGGRWSPLRENQGGEAGGAAPGSRQPAAAPLQERVAWVVAHPGVEWGAVEISAGGLGGTVDLVVARIAPGNVRLELQWERDPATGQPNWDLDRTPGDAWLSLNAGMFLDTVPWGWVRLGGVDRLAPGRGPLSSALAVDTSGGLHWVDGDEVSALRARRDIAMAFQSYPTLLTGEGTIPPALLAGSLIDRRHRDIRLALGLDHQGRLLVALTRCGLPIPGAGRLPLGLTVPEMAEVMGALGARQAMLLDGGLSAQMQLRDATGARHRWEGLRKVPLALIVTGRTFDPGDFAGAGVGAEGPTVRATR